MSCKHGVTRFCRICHEEGVVTHTRAELKQFLGNVQSADLTASKTALIVNDGGYRITGFVVTHPAYKNSGIIDKSAVRWLNKDGWWWLMHLSEGHNPGDVYEHKRLVGNCPTASVT